MTRKQRRAHVRVWSLLLVALLAIFGAALIVRERASEAVVAVRHALGGGDHGA